MTTRPDDDRAERTAELVTTIAVAASADSTLVALAEAATPPLAAWGVKIVIAARRQVAARRLSRWLTELGSALGGRSPDDIQQLIEEGLERPGTAELLLESFQHLMSVLHEATIPTIAKLMAEYLKDNGDGARELDLFFRATGRFLADAEAVDVRAAEHLLPRLAACIDDRTTNVVLQASRKEDEQHVQLKAHRRDGSPATSEDVPHDLAPELVNRLFLLLRRSGLGHENASGYYDTVAGPHVVVIDAATLNRLARILSSSDADS